MHFSALFFIEKGPGLVSGRGSSTISYGPLKFTVLVVPALSWKLHLACIIMC